LLFLPPNSPFPHSFPKGAVLLIDKPLAWTSFDVVNKVRYALTRRLGIKKLKVGHAGTLDPLATGLLILCVGDYTKQIDAFQAEDKEYTGTLTLGATTPSYDLEKAVDATFPVDHITPELIESARQEFIGTIRQLPPVFSAVKVEGKRMYDTARSGREQVAEARSVRIEAFEVSNLRPVPTGTSAAAVISAKGAPIYLHPEHQGGLQVDFRVRCGKGTYIRSLAYDFGRALGSGAYLSRLRRTRSGGFSVDDAWDLDTLVAWIRGNDPAGLSDKTGSK
jgi:tRNA pseudouridine55 synthase